MELQDLTPIHSPELDVHMIVEVKPGEANLLDQGYRVFPLWWLSHAISKIYYTQPLSTMVTTLWLKQSICFCSDWGKPE